MSNVRKINLKKVRFLFSLALLLLIFLIGLKPEKFITSALNGISAWALNVLPCILPFMILTKILLSLGELEKFSRPFAKPFKFLFGTSSKASYVFFMSVLSGYPVGSKMTADLFESRQISKTEAYRMSSFCSNSGPMFIVGTVGALLLKSPVIGFILFISHILSALLNGLVFRNIKAKEDENLVEKTEKIEFSFADIVSSSVQSVLTVGGIICLFFIVIDALAPIFSFLPESLIPLAEGVVELTRGCIDASVLPTFVAAVSCSFLISFGGFSTILQSSSMLKKLKMPVWLFSVMKLSHGLISAVLTAIFMLLV